MKAKAVPCKSSLCDRPTRNGYCPKHSEGHVADAFSALIKPMLEGIGAQAKESHVDDFGGWCLTLQTRAGLLTFTFFQGDLSLYSRFEDPDAAVKLLGNSFGHGAVNPYSGKWNHHHWGNSNAEMVADQVFRQIKSII